MSNATNLLEPAVDAAVESGKETAARRDQGRFAFDVTHGINDPDEAREAMDMYLHEPLAFFDPDTLERYFPVGEYTQREVGIGEYESTIRRIRYWEKRNVAPKGMRLHDIQAAGLDYLDPQRGWIRAGKKGEYDPKPAPKPDLTPQYWRS